MKTSHLDKILSANEYPGRGIVVGKTADGQNAIAAYWIMGRSAPSRNRVFIKDGDGIRTQAFDASLEGGDSSLIIYSAVRTLSGKLIVTNGDQTDTIYSGLKSGLTFEQALRSRKYEHDAPNYTPRISALLDFAEDNFSYFISILKTDNGDPKTTLRQTFEYENPQNGKGHLIHTYAKNSKPLPSFSGEPVPIEIPELGADGIDAFTNMIWDSLNAENKVSLFVRFIDIATGEYESRIVNKNIPSPEA